MRRPLGLRRPYGHGVGASGYLFALRLDLL